MFKQIIANHNEKNNNLQHLTGVYILIPSKFINKMEFFF